MLLDALSYLDVELKSTKKRRRGLELSMTLTIYITCSAQISLIAGEGHCLDPLKALADLV